MLYATMMRGGVAAQHRRRAVLAGVALASLLATLPTALGRPLTGDEVSSAIVITRPSPGAALLQVVRGESTPPLWYGLAWLGHAAGLPLPWLRLLSAAAMAGAAALTAEVGRHAGLPPWGAALAGLLVAVGDAFVEHGGELRAYALFCLLSAGFALVLERAAAGRGRPWALAAVVAAGTLTHYFFLFGIAAGVISIVADPRTRPRRRELLAAVAVGLLPLLLWAPALAHQYRAQRYGWIGVFSWRTLAASLSDLFVSGWVVRPASALPDVAGVAVVAAGVVVLARSPAGRLSALLAAVPPVGGALLWELGSPVFALRNIIGAGPFLAVAVATLLVRLRRTGMVAGTILVLALVAARVYAGAHLGRTDYRPVSSALVAEGWRPDDPIALFGPLYGSVALAWYLPGHPRLDPMRAAARSCPRLFVVAESGRGRAWLRRRQPLARRAIPAFGATDRGPPSAPFVVARLSPPRTSLRAAGAGGARLLAVRGAETCA